MTMTIDIRCARSVEEFASVETAPEHVADTAKYLQRLFDTGCSRLDWCFIAEPGGERAARLALWSLPGIDKPLDFVLLNADWRAAAAMALLHHIEALFRSAGCETIGHCLDIPPREPQWQTEPAARQGLLQQAGYKRVRHTVRYRLVTPPAGDEPTTNIELAPLSPVDEDLLLSLVAEVASESHDQLDRDGCAEHGATEHARLLLEDLREMRVDEGWWRIAWERGANGQRGAAVGFILPAASADMGTIGYVGIRPAYRGRRLVDALLRYTARVLAQAGLPKIIADTDRSNLPMARAFERNGWNTFGERLEWKKRL
jgi:RimJ/RimL family protein N-acetyltransferase